MTQKFINIPPLDLDTVDPVAAITALTGDATATGPGSVPITFATVNATTGTFGSTGSVGVFTVNEKGLITQATNAMIVAGAGGITQLTGDVLAGPGNASQAATLATVNATTGTFGSSGTVGVFTVNQKGLIVSSSSVAIAFDGGITQITGDLTAGPGSGTQAGTLATVNATTGTFGNTTAVGVFTVNRKGLITSASTAAIAFDGGITQLTGDATAGPGSGSQALTLATVNATTGTFGSTGRVAIFTVNQKGLVISSSSVAIPTGGITQLTGDVTAGPGTGSQAATVRNVGVYASSSVVAATSAALGATPSSIPGTIVSRAVDANSATFFAVDRVNSSTVTPSIDLKNSNLIDGSGVSSVDWTNRQINYTSSSASINWGTGVMYDGVFRQSLDYSSRLLMDTNAIQSVDWNNRNLRDSSLAVIADWQGKVLYSNSTGTSIDWFNRSLVDARNAQSVDYNARLLQSSGSFNTLDWQNTLLLDDTGTKSVDWDLRRVFDTKTNFVADWENRQLRTSSSAISAKWDINGFAAIAMSSTGATATATTGLGAGDGSSVSVTGSGALSGTIGLTTGSVLGPVSTTAVTVTLNAGNIRFVKRAKLFLQPTNLNSNSLFGPTQVFPVPTTGANFSIITGSSGLEVSKTYNWSYFLVG